MLFRFVDIFQQATDLYGIIHARFILTAHGATLMKQKFLTGDFGSCPRVCCRKQYVLPIATTEELGVSRVKIYCPKCQDVYVPKDGSTDLDGAYFGWSFPESFLQYFPDINSHITGPEKYTPKLYGFRVFGKKCSRYEVIYDEKGNPVNTNEIEEVKANIVYDSNQHSKVVNPQDIQHKSIPKSMPISGVCDGFIVENINEAHQNLHEID